MRFIDSVRLLAASILCWVFVVGVINQNGKPQPGTETIPPAIVQLLNSVDDSLQQKKRQTKQKDEKQDN
ncbi:MAG: hypothetical protein F6K47_13520 [Symploca sp. SIO2E6]|nr:hypothetical protein [Symploca sp. SIO2E6]